MAVKGGGMLCGGSPQYGRSLEDLANGRPHGCCDLDLNSFEYCVRRRYQRWWLWDAVGSCVCGRPFVAVQVGTRQRKFLSFRVLCQLQSNDHSSSHNTP